MLSHSSLVRYQGLYIFVLITMILLSTVAGTRAYSIPHLKSQAYLLYPSQLKGYDEDSYTLEFNSVLSQDGQFVVGITTMYQMAEFHAFLQLWDTNRFEMGIQLYQIQPNGSYDLGVNTERPTISISPDGHYVVVLIGRKLNIFRLPALEPYEIRLVDNLEVQDAVWSPDGGLIGMLTDNQLVAYDMKTHEFYMQLMPKNRHSEYPPNDIESMETGWLYRNRNDQVFAVCQWRLEICNTYQLQEELYILPKPDGSQIVGFSDDSTATKATKLWNLQNGTEYRANDIVFSGFGRAVFSPTGKYIAGYQYLSPNEGPSMVMYDFDHLRRMFVDPVGPERGRLPTWLPNEKFFLTVNSDLFLKLYQTDSATLLQTLDLKSIDPEAIVNEPVKFHTDEYLSIQLDEKGDKALIKFAYSAMLLPIIYE